MKYIIKQIIKYVFDKYEIQDIEQNYSYITEIVNKKNKQRLEQETGNKLRLGMEIRSPFIRVIKLK